MMTTKKEMSVKFIRFILPVILLLVIAAAVFGYKRKVSNSEQQSQKALGRLLSCTMEQVGEFEAAADAAMALAAAADDEPGLVQADEELRDYFVEQFGDFMTNECIEDLVMSRTFGNSIALAKELNSDIEAGEIELTKRSGGECYTFSAEIKTTAGTPAADAQGTITMEKDGTEWKASQITMTMNGCNDE